ncbi:hypothetical protein [Streptomyces sp. NPDC058985]|uniref:protein kinase domain-containing protein n=1 Tax=Streptomyces sp. NPDC058985 TaxID=3346684 RepID=UPI0036C53802
MLGTYPVRNAWLSPPEWATLPALATDGANAHGGGTPAGGRVPSPVLLGGRFLVREALRHSNRGGVYRALDRHYGDRRTVAKEARPHIDARPDGIDARDHLHNEYRTLTVLEPLGIAVRPVDLFEHQGHLFLAEEEVPGTTLYRWARERELGEPGRGLAAGQVLPTARRLVELVAAVHDKGLVIRDFAPSNVMVTPDGDPLLIDTEFVAAVAEPVTGVGTPGFTAPEVCLGSDRTSPATSAADLYGLGATLFHLCTGFVPLLPEDRPGTTRAVAPRSHDERVRQLVTAASADSPALAVLAPLITRLMREDPEERPAPAEARDALHAPPAQPTAAGKPRCRVPVDAGRLLTDGWDQLVAALDPSSDRAPWPVPATCPAVGPRERPGLPPVAVGYRNRSRAD